MDILFIVTSSLFLLWIIRQLFFWLAVWQQNEYRQDRFFASFRRRSRKHKLLSTLFPIGKWLVFFAYGFVIFNDKYLLTYEYSIVALYLLLAFFLLQEIYFNKLKKPKITFRVTLIILLTLAMVLFLFAFPLLDRFFWLLFIDLLIPWIIGFFVLISTFPIEIYNDWQTEKAGQKIRNNPQIFVIAVTGSVGKSLTKDYIAEVLSKKFRVIKTIGKDNTVTSVSRTILKKLDSTTQIFVAEISAYSEGEIAMLSSLIRPNIGVLTAINSYYIPPFKNIEKIKETNFELVESLPKDGLCLYNGNSKNTLSLYKRARKNKVLYQTLPNGKGNPSVVNRSIAFNIVHKPRRTTFTVMLKEKQLQLTLGNFHHIEALLPALFIASHLGMTEREIKRAVAGLK